MSIGKSGPRHINKSTDTKCLMCDEQVREARRLHEQEGKGPTELAKQFGVKQRYMEDVLNGVLRSNVF